jgi:UDP-3-O-[3-hydroxymyristoyl] glucosamine N-acyltransferase
VTTLGDLAAMLSGRLAGGDPGAAVTGIAPLSRAIGTELAFVSEKRYLAGLTATRAACVLLAESWESEVESPVPVIFVADPYLAYARASRLFEGAEPEFSVHSTALIDSSVQLPRRVSIGAYACIEADVTLGEDVIIGPGCFIGRGARLGDRTRLMANVTLYHGVHLGARCRVHSATVIGADGFGFARRADGWERIAQLGGVRIGDDVDIGATVTIDRGALDDTVIESGVIIDDKVHIGHNCRIGERTAIAGCAGIAGSTQIGAGCTLAGQVGVSGHLEICDNVHLGGQARVTKSIREPGAYSSGTPLEPSRQWARNAVRFSQLESLQRRVSDIEGLQRRVSELEELQRRVNEIEAALTRLTASDEGRADGRADKSS